MADKSQRSLDIAIRARADYAKELKKAKSDFDAFGQSLNKAALNRKGQMEAVKAIREQGNALKNASADAAKLNSELRNLGEATNQSDSEYFSRIAQGAYLAGLRVKDAKAGLQKHREELNRLRGIVQGSFKDFNQRAAAIQGEAAAARIAAREAAALTAAQTALENQLAQTTTRFSAFAAEQAKLGKSDNDLRNSLRSVTAAKIAYEQAWQEANAYGRALAAARKEGGLAEADQARLNAEFKEAKDRLGAAKEALTQKQIALRNLKGITQSNVREAMRHQDALATETRAMAQAAIAADRLAAARKPIARSDGSARTQIDTAQAVTVGGKRGALLEVRAARQELLSAQDAAQSFGRALAQVKRDGDLSGAAIAKLDKDFSDLRKAVGEAEQALIQKVQALNTLKGAQQSSFVEAIKQQEAFSKTATAANEARRASEAQIVQLGRVSKEGQSAEAQSRKLANAFRGTNEELRKNARASADAARNGLQRYRQEQLGIEKARLKEKIEAATRAIEAQGGVASRAARTDLANYQRRLAEIEAQSERIGRGKRAGFFERTTAAWGTQQGRGPLGLRPYELTNLGYQVNDVVSGLAMGQAPMQIFAQQAGQIIQLFPKMMTAILRLAPALAILSPFALALGRIAQESSQLRDLQRNLDLMATGASYSARELKGLSDELVRNGASVKDAKTALDTFLGARLDTGVIRSLAEASQAMASVTGGKMQDVAGDFATAFGKGVEGVRELDTQIGFLSASQYEQIRAMEDSGDSAGALALAARALRNRVQDAKGETEGWSAATKELGNAWDALISTLADSSALQAVAAGFRDLGTFVGRLAKDFADLTSGGEIVTLLPEVKLDLAIDDARLAAEIETARAMVEAGLRNPVPDFLADWLGTERMQEAEAYFSERLRLLQQEQDRRRSIAQEAENQAKLEQDIQDIVDDTVESLRKQVEQAGMTSREREIQKALDQAREEALQRAIELGITFLGLTEQQTAAIRAQVGALYDRNNAMDAEQYGSRYAAERMAGGQTAANSAELVAAATMLAEANGWKVEDLLTTFSYETAGTMDPWKRGQTTQWGTHRGLIQWGEPQAARYGVGPDTSITDQVMAVGRYLLDHGVKPGDGLLPIYAAINAGNAKNIHASDANNGGAPGTVLDKVNDQMGGHRARARGMLDAYAGIREESEAAVKAAEKEADARERAAERASDFHTSQAQSVELQEYENSLSGESAENRARLLAIKRAEVAAQRAGTELTDAERQRIGDAAAEEARLSEAKKASGRAQKEKNAAIKEGKALEAEINRLMQERDRIEANMATARTAGDNATFQTLKGQLDGVNSELEAAMANAMSFWQAMGGEAGAAGIARIEELKHKLAEASGQVVVTADQMDQMFTGAILNGFETFAKAVAEGTNAWQALGMAIRQVASEILIELGKMILKQIIFNMVSGAFGGGGGIGLGGRAAGAINGMFFHEGGKVGAAGEGRSKPVPAAAFANAVRYHSGGIAGLAPNEVPAVLEENEEVLTADNPRHRDNISKGGKEQGGRMGTIINAFDSPSFLESALNTAEGQEVFYNFVRANKDSFMSVLGD